VKGNDLEDAKKLRGFKATSPEIYLPAAQQPWFGTIFLFVAQAAFEKPQAFRSPRSVFNRFFSLGSFALSRCSMWKSWA
jgi:hypothetical protein